MTSKPFPSGVDFAAKIERQLASAYGECFTPETTKIRRFLLVVSSIMVLMMIGVIRTDETPWQLPGVSISVTTNTGLTWLLIVFNSYLVVLFSTRSYMEWNLWRLQTFSRMIGLLGIAHELRELMLEYNDGDRSDSKAHGMEIRRALGEDPYEAVDSMYRYIITKMRPAKMILSIRFWFEMLAPILFGFITIIASILV
ncbi:MAG: hypothetical protein AAF637_08385 [Pseudomonadota bacterium]